MAKSNRKRANSLAVTQPGDANVYLSCSWQKDAGQDASWLVVDALDRLRLTCLGDVKVSGDQDPARITRILGQCSGAVVVIPYRSNGGLPTSQYIWQELELAAGEGLPILLWFDSRVPLRVTNTVEGKRITIGGSPSLSAIDVGSDQIRGPLAFHLNGVADADAIRQHHPVLEGFVEQVKLTSATSGEPFAFFSTRLKQDFGLARGAVLHALDAALGVTCLWADSNRYSTTLKNVQDRTHCLIANAQFVVADLTFGPESPDYDSPSRAHEVGMAEALEKEILLTAQAPRRSPYFAASHLQMEFWKDEQQLYETVFTWADNRKARYGRRIYNRELSTSVPGHQAELPLNQFQYDEQQHYIAPNAYALTSLESTVVAIGFAMIALATSFLAKDLLAFDDTFDFASIIAALATVVFASDLNGLIRGCLIRWAPLRWLVPATGLVMLAIWATVHFAR